MKTLVRYKIDEDGKHPEDTQKVNKALNSIGYRLFQVTTIVAGHDSRWPRHYVWFLKEEKVE